MVVAVTLGANEFPVARMVPPVATLYQFTVPEFATAERFTIPESHLEPGVVAVISGCVLTVAITAVLVELQLELDAST